MNFLEAVTRIPAPGGGGCHAFLLTCANIGVREGLDEDAMFRAIRDNVPTGGREVHDGEIRQAIRKAMHDRLNGRVYAKPTGGLSFTNLRRVTQTDVARFMHPDAIQPEDFIEASPVQFEPEDYTNQMIEVLTHLYGLNEHLFIGQTTDTAVYTVQQWIDAIGQTVPENIPPQMIWNPMTGEQGKTKEGKLSYRCDSTIAEYRFSMVEFDEMSMEDQLRFWAGCRLPVAAIIYSGGKSLHGILKISNVRNKSEWNATVRDTIYNRWLIPLGVDKTCHNPSRLSRSPGAYRADKGKYQTLLYLNPAATPIYLE